MTIFKRFLMLFALAFWLALSAGACEFQVDACGGQSCWVDCQNGDVIEQGSEEVESECYSEEWVWSQTEQVFHITQRRTTCYRIPVLIYTGGGATWTYWHTYCETVVSGYWTSQ